MQPANGNTGKNFRRLTLRLCALTAAGIAATPGWAFYNDRVEVWVAELATWDSNVFRLSSNLDPNVVLGSPTTRDRILTHNIGITADVPVSLQRFQLSYQHFWTRYQRFDHLDFDGDIWRAAWLWAVSSELNGDVGYLENTGLASFAAFPGTTRDVVKTRQAFATGNWKLNSRWIAYGGLGATERRHEDPARSVNDLQARTAEARLSYVTPRENRVGVSIRYEDGGAPETHIYNGVPFDNAYQQWGIGVVGRWEPTPHSRFDGRIDHVNRQYDQFPERNYRGPAWGVTYTWMPSEKFTVGTTLRRDIAPLEDVQTSFVLSTGVAVKPRWQVSEKVALLGSLDYSRWHYKGDPLTGGDFEHTVRGASMGFTWTPLQRVVITGNIAHERRTSTLQDADYKVTIGTLDARIGF